MDRRRERKAGAAYGIGVSLFVIAFALAWCAVVAAMGAWFMLIFGIFFLALAVFRLVMCIRMAKNEKNAHPDPSREADPWDRPSRKDPASTFCPYCGASMDPDFRYCPHCGRGVR